MTSVPPNEPKSSDCGRKTRSQTSPASKAKTPAPSIRIGARIESRAKDAKRPKHTIAKHSPPGHLKNLSRLAAKHTRATSANDSSLHGKVTYNVTTCDKTNGDKQMMSGKFHVNVATSVFYTNNCLVTATTPDSPNRVVNAVTTNCEPSSCVKASDQDVYHSFDPNAPVSPAPDNPYSNERICVCNNFTRILKCQQCKPRKPCGKHELITCTNCEECFHKGCITSYGHDSANYVCMHCEAKAKQVCIPADYADITFTKGVRSKWHNKGERFGLSGKTPQSMKTLVEKCEAALDPTVSFVDSAIEALSKLPAEIRDVIPDVINPQALLDSIPIPYPSPFKLEEGVSDRARLSGRQFNASMLCFMTKRCDNCGKTMPTHSCPIMKQASKPFDQRHLVTAFVGVWHCSCSNCKGSQFYPDKPHCISEFRRLHKGQHPTEFISDLPDAQDVKDRRFNYTVCKPCCDYYGAKAENSEYCFGVKLFFISTSQRVRDRHGNCTSSVKAVWLWPSIRAQASASHGTTRQRIIQLFATL